jgi:predicted peptidase
MSGPALQLVDSYPLRYLLRPRISTKADESPPLLCFLHGYDEGAPLDIFDALSRHGPFRSLNQSTYKDRFVNVAPQLPVRGDLWNRCADTVRQIVLDEAKKFACDLRRLYLTGFSFGGNGVFDLAFAQTRNMGGLMAGGPYTGSNSIDHNADLALARRDFTIGGAQLHSHFGP